MLAAEDTSALAALGEAVLQALSLISSDAAGKLGERPAGIDPLLAENARAKLRQIFGENRSALIALKREPTIARLEIEWLDNKKTEYLYVCRASSSSVGPDGLDGRLVSYRAPLGRLAEIPAGDEETIVLPFGRREALVRCRLLVHPRLDASGWDAVDNAFELLDQVVGVDSIRRLIEHARRAAVPIVDYLADILAEDEAKQLFFDQRRRKTVDRMALRDQPILDQFQGSVFRLPLDRQVLLLGPPGAGKTTTLIRRLAQKRTEEALTADENERLTELGLKTEFMSDSGWVMFSPTELLKLYVREAFNREGVPATADNLRTWSAERIALGRDVLRFLKGASGGRFTLGERDDSLSDSRSVALGSLYEEFSAAVDQHIVRRCSEALDSMDNGDDEEARNIARQVRLRFKTAPLTIETVHSFAENSEFLRSALGGLSDRISQEERQLANVLVSPDPAARLKALHELLNENPPPMGDGSDDDEEDDADEDAVGSLGRTWDQAATAKLLLGVVRSMAQEAASGRTRTGRSILTKVGAWVAGREIDQNQLISLGRKVRLRMRIRLLEGAARNLVYHVPAVYTQFRRQCAAAGRYYSPDAGAANRSSVLTPLEADIVILAMLTNARRALHRFPGAAWLDALSGRYLMQIFVDECTDFSCVQLACMLALTHPRLRAWFACGDFRQRITGSGVMGPDEIEWIRRVAHVPELEIRTITSEYRQSRRLKEFANALTAPDAGIDGVYPAPTRTDDPAPLLAEGIQGEALGKWLAERIIDVERLVGRLPSIAVFVDSEDGIDPIVKSTASFLAERNIRIVGCRDGRDVGNLQEVRVFDIRHIKGLEFEAVFFIGVDTLAIRMPLLFEKYIYVGVTRAATFLGIACNERLPERLEVLRPLFSGGAWK